MNDKDHEILTTQDDLVQTFQTLDLYCARTLPDDCIHTIIDQLRSDRKGLHNLLFVNKFFFKIAIRHLYRYHDPIDDYEWHRKRKQVLVILVSFLQQRIMESMDAPGSDRSHLEIVEEILDKFGLELNLDVPYQPSGIAFLQQLYGSTSNHNDIECDPSSFSPLTMDYSKLSTDFQKDKVAVVGLFRLKYKDSFDQSESQHFRQLQDIWGVNPLDPAIFDMWIYYNSASITKLEFGTRFAYRFLPYATKLSGLETLSLEGAERMVESEFEDAASFIRQNQLAFPWKTPLKVLSFDEHQLRSRSERPVINATNHHSYISNMKVCRSKILQHIRPIITIYEAIESPSVLRVHSIPDFYNLAQNIRTERLIELYDNDRYRFEMGEIESMRRFIQRCTKLRKLAITISHPEAFPWATPSCHGNLENLPIELEDLDIAWESSCFAAIMAFNEAIRIFPRLKSVTLVNANHDNWYTIPTFVSNISTLRALQLQHITSATTICNFTTLIPNLTSLTIVLRGVSSINIGSLSYLQNLEYLTIGITMDYHDKYRPSGEEPTTLPEPDVLLDPGWKQLEEDLSLFPEWNLPKLKSLILRWLAATRFDFASLLTMPRLEKLVLGGNPNSNNENILDYLCRQCKIPIDVSSISSLKSLQFRVFEKYLTRELSLASLTQIYLSGVSCAMFCLEYLRYLPGLKSLELYRALSIPPMELYSKPDLILSNSNVIAADSGVHILNDKIFEESQLESIRFIGQWRMSSQDLISLLSVYAPFLKFFTADTLQCRDSRGLYSVIKAINQADLKNDVFGGINSQVDVASAPNLNLGGEKLPGRQLVDVKLGGRITAEEAKDLGITRIREGDVGLYRAQQVRIYYLFAHQSLYIRERDYETISKKSSVTNQQGETK
ncbi:hypothetical protein BGZ76_002982 [Entomortierella beljakovae]|nr:hypothetical protein BGZ76_002982 [Entomortierella beljakovae]